MIYAVDFDGTLCSNRFPNIGKPNIKLIDFLIHEQLNGHKIILNTMREDKFLDEAVVWCSKHGLKFDAINDNLQEMKDFYKNNPRKIFANVYVDDHNAKSGICVNLPFEEDN